MSFGFPVQAASPHYLASNSILSESRGMKEIKTQKRKCMEVLDSFSQHVVSNTPELVPLVSELKFFLKEIQDRPSRGGFSSIKRKSQFSAELTSSLTELIDLIKTIVNVDQLQAVKSIITALVSKVSERNSVLLRRINEGTFEIGLVKSGVYSTVARQRDIIISRLVWKKLWECDPCQIVKKADVTETVGYLIHAFETGYQSEFILPASLTQSDVVDLCFQVNLLASNMRMAAKAVEQIVYEAIELINEKRQCVESQSDFSLDIQNKENRLNQQLQCLFDCTDFDLGRYSNTGSDSKIELQHLFIALYKRGCDALGEVLPISFQIPFSSTLTGLNDLRSSYGLCFHLFNTDGEILLTLDCLNKTDWYEFPVDICFNMLEQVIRQTQDLEQLIRFIQSKSFNTFLSDPNYQRFGEYLRQIIVDRFNSSSTIQSELLKKFEQTPLRKDVLALSCLLPEVESIAKVYVNYHKKHFSTLPYKDIRKIPLNTLLTFSQEELDTLFNVEQMSYFIVKALKLGEEKVAVWLMAHANSLGGMSWSGVPILYLLCQSASLEVFISLNNTSRFNLNEATSNGEPLIYVAIKTRIADVVHWLLNQPKLKLTYQDRDQNSLLHISMLYYQEKITEAIIRRSVMKSDNSHIIHTVNAVKNTPLHTACYLGASRAVESLINAGARTDQENYKNELPVDIALRQGHADIVKLLITNGQTAFDLTRGKTISAVKFVLNESSNNTNYSKIIKVLFDNLSVEELKRCITNPSEE